MDQYPSEVASKCIYQFTCTFGSKYIGRTESRVSARFSEHIHCMLCLKRSKVILCAITKHLIDSRHNVVVSNVFKIINRQCTPLLHRFSEAIAIKRFQPDLYTERECTKPTITMVRQLYYLLIMIYNLR